MPLLPVCSPPSNPMCVYACVCVCLCVAAGKEPTIVSPKQYMRRFRAAITSYFTVVPDGREMEPPLDPDAP